MGEGIHDRHALVVILDFGSQYTQLIARRVRELRVYCEIHPFSISADEVAKMQPQALILSGGPASVLAEGAPHADPKLLELDCPVLGICYGLQWMCHVKGGVIERATSREYGAADITITAAEGLFSRLEEGERTRVWMSHGDRVIQLPEGFIPIANTPSAPFAAVADERARVFGVQFHPEVMHSTKGTAMLSGFLFDVAGCHADWTPASFVDESVERIREKVGQGRAVCALSGGVDSSVAAAIVASAIGDRLTCIFVDNGLLRHQEVDQVRALYQNLPQLDLRIVDAKGRFLSALAGVTDPEKKRKIIGNLFITIFEEEAHALSGVDFLVQGTLYPDVIESVSLRGPSAVIKSHHNVGGLPERMKLKLVEPLRELFKDEVRLVGRALGLPQKLLGRHPFPGPGLAVRCLGEVQEERLRILREADAIFIEELHAGGFYDQVWQAFCVILPVNTVGVMGDERTYDPVIALRAIDSTDGMTADWSRLPHTLLSKVSSRITNEVVGCNRVVYDISSKPPATVEWE